MFNINRNIIAKLVIFFAVVILFPMLYRGLKSPKNIAEKPASVDHKKHLSVFLAQVKAIWDYKIQDTRFMEQKNECLNEISSEFQKMDGYFECNPSFLKCMLDKNSFENFEILKKNGEILSSKKSHQYIQVRDKILNKVFSVQLENHCHEKYLPANSYNAGVEVSKKYMWDNFMYDVYIDKYYAHEFESDKILTLTEMNNFCRSQGKSLLESRYFDAATFFPSKNKVIYKHPYPWTKSSRSFLSSDEKLNHGHCENAYVKECIELKKYNQFAGYSLSWMGIDHSLGGLPEAFRNIFNHRANIKLSSYFLLRSSLWHKNGARAYWNGSGFFQKDFEQVEQYTKRMIQFSFDKIKVAFRCVRLK